MEEFSLSVDSDKVATILWDIKSKSMNVLTQKGSQEFYDLIDKAVDDKEIKGIIVTSGKKDFAGGMDLSTLSNLRSTKVDNPSQEVFKFIMTMHNKLRKLEQAGMDPKTTKGGKPVAWACPGLSAGIGTEIGLACHKRFLADSPRAKVGLPEILVGLFPGAGGTTRLVRMLGAMAASPLLLEGKMLNPKAARAAGLVDEIVEPEKLLESAKKWILEADEDELVKAWDKKGYKMPGGNPYHPSGFMTFVGASAMVNSRTQGVYPAAKALLSVAYEGSLVPFDTALKIEARWFTHILGQENTSNMIRSLFLNKTALDKGATRPSQVPNQNIKKLGVLGAGMMGSGIAYVSASSGIDVVLIDQNQESVSKGMESITNILDQGIKRGKISNEKKESILGRITATEDYSLLRGSNLVVEAVFEDTQVKELATKKAQKYLDEGTVFATNTSTLPIGKLAEASISKAEFIGIHFFSPVHKMALVEIIKGKDTGEKAVATALDFVKQIRKTPIVVNDARFFYANRCIIPYINEGVRMIGEGVEPALIENAARQLGMPVGPLQLIDETSIDLGVRIAKETKEALGNMYEGGATDEVLKILYDSGRLGKKSNAGFYSYNEKGKRLSIWEGLRDHWEPSKVQPDVSEVKNRLAMIQALEAVRAIEDGVLTDIREGDVGAILGWGCMPWAGGPLSWLDLIGAKEAVSICNSLESNHGSRFSPPDLLTDLINKNETFYTRFPDGKAN